MKILNLRYRFTVILMVLFMVTGCDNFIGISPDSAATTDELYQTDKHFKDALMGCYAALQDPYDYFWLFSDLRGDDVGSYVPKYPERALFDDFDVGTNVDFLNDTWQGYYNTIYRANLLLSKIENVDTSTVPNKEQYIAEAKFLRALAYFDIVRIWGPVPMYTDPISIEESYEIGRQDVNTIYEQVIIPGLQEAENILPNEYSASEIGRVTSGAAKALLGKVYLTRKNFSEAEGKLAEVTTMGYELLDDFNDLFDYEVEHHSEYIFDIEYIDGGLELGSVYTTEFMVEVPTVGNEEIVAALQNKYGIQAITGTGSSGSPEDGFFEIFEEGDLRKEITAAKGVTDENGNFIPLEGGSIPSITFKYMTPLVLEDDSRANWKVLRYADVLLMYAEALNENGKSNLALQYLNQVRERAGLDGIEGLSQDETREEIYFERRRELYLEGHRWFDLIRTGRALETMQAQGKNMQDYHVVFPIPQSQIDVVSDPSVLPQNPGY